MEYQDLLCFYRKPKYHKNSNDKTGKSKEKERKQFILDTSTFKTPVENNRRPKNFKYCCYQVPVIKYDSNKKGNTTCGSNLTPEIASDKPINQNVTALVNKYIVDMVRRKLDSGKTSENQKFIVMKCISTITANFPKGFCDQNQSSKFNSFNVNSVVPDHRTGSLSVTRKQSNSNQESNNDLISCNHKVDIASTSVASNLFKCSPECTETPNVVKKHVNIAKCSTTNAGDFANGRRCMKKRATGDAPKLQALQENDKKGTTIMTSNSYADSTMTVGTENISKYGQSSLEIFHAINKYIAAHKQSMTSNTKNLQDFNYQRRFIEKIVQHLLPSSHKPLQSSTNNESATRIKGNQRTTKPIHDHIHAKRENKNSEVKYILGKSVDQLNDEEKEIFTYRYENNYKLSSGMPAKCFENKKNKKELYRICRQLSSQIRNAYNTAKLCKHTNKKEFIDKSDDRTSSRSSVEKTVEVKTVKLSKHTTKKGFGDKGDDCTSNSSSSDKKTKTVKLDKHTTKKDFGDKNDNSTISDKKTKTVKLDKHTTKKDFGDKNDISTIRSSSNEKKKKNKKEFGDKSDNSTSSSSSSDDKKKTVKLSKNKTKQEFGDISGDSTSSSSSSSSDEKIIEVKCSYVRKCCCKPKFQTIGVKDHGIKDTYQPERDEKIDKTAEIDKRLESKTSESSNIKLKSEGNNSVGDNQLQVKPEISEKRNSTTESKTSIIESDNQRQRPQRLKNLVEKSSWKKHLLQLKNRIDTAEINSDEDITRNRKKQTLKTDKKIDKAKGDEIPHTSKILKTPDIATNMDEQPQQSKNSVSFTPKITANKTKQINAKNINIPAKNKRPPLILKHKGDNTGDKQASIDVATDIKKTPESNQTQHITPNRKKQTLKTDKKVDKAKKDEMPHTSIILKTPDIATNMHEQPQQSKNSVSLTPEITANKTKQINAKNINVPAKNNRPPLILKHKGDNTGDKQASKGVATDIKKTPERNQTQQTNVCPEELKICLEKDPCLDNQQFADFLSEKEEYCPTSTCLLKMMPSFLDPHNCLRHWSTVPPTYFSMNNVPKKTMKMPSVTLPRECNIHLDLRYMKSTVKYLLLATFLSPCLLVVLSCQFCLFTAGTR